MAIELFKINLSLIIDTDKKGNLIMITHLKNISTLLDFIVISPINCTLMAWMIILHTINIRDLKKGMNIDIRHGMRYGSYEIKNSY